MELVATSDKGSPQPKASLNDLSRSLALLRATLDATHDAILVTDAHGNITDYNQQFIQVWRLPPELHGAKHYDVVLEHNSRQFEDAQAFLSRIRQIYESEAEISDQLLLRDGRIIERFSRVQKLDGVAIGRVWSFRDVTNARRAEESRMRLAAIVESSEDAIISKSLEGIISTWNSGAQRIFGYTAPEVIGKPVTILFPPELVPEEAHILARVRRAEPIRHYETERVRKDGKRIIVSLSVSPLRDDRGNIIGASKIARDITEQRRQAQALAASEARLRALVEATPECVMIVAADGSLVFVNSAGLQILEIASEQEALEIQIQDFVAPEHREMWLANHDRACRGERLSFEFELIGVNGARRWLETHAVPLLLPDARRAELAVVRDVTARKRADQEREQLLHRERSAREDAETASRLKDEFLATLSHELRTPLNAILGWSQLLSRDPTTDDMQQGLEAIQRNARAQTQLIEDLLDMSRIISGKVRLDVQWTDLTSVIDAAVETVRPAAEAKDIRIRKILDSQAAPVTGDPTRLQQVIWNLLSNAIKFTSRGGKIEVLLERVNSHVEITVQDNGVGIKPEFLPVIFERFRQADSSTKRSYGGLGLGLSIVKHLVELHGGSVRAKSGGENQGATFIVSLPVASVRREERREHPTAVKPPPLDYKSIDLTGIKVLLVDDELDARKLVTNLLNQCKAEVRTAASADEGMQALGEFQPDVIVSDIGMPQKDGYDFIRDVRQLGAEKGGKTPAIALTAFARSEDRTRVMMAGYQVHVTKPVEPQELLATVGSLAGRTGRPN
jgi:PAS domain S-box-containing protein